MDGAARATSPRRRPWNAPARWRPAVYTVGLVPAAWTLYLALGDQLGADPMRVLERTLGLWALRFLILGLMVTPLLRLGGPNLLAWRRALGVLAFVYALLHVLVYVVLDQQLDLVAILRDITRRTYITVGLVAFLVLIPLAVTSHDWMVRRLGALRWQRLHKLVYLAVAAGGGHFILSVKSWPAEPTIYLAIVAGLLGWRLWDGFRRQRARAERAVHR